MFQYMCTIFRENIMPFLKNLVQLRHCYLYVPLSIAASLLALIVCNTYCSFTYRFLRINIIFSLKIGHM